MRIARALLPIPTLLAACSLVTSIPEDASENRGGGPVGTGGTALSGGGGATSCVDGDVCYAGPEGTRDVGECRAGVQTCGPDGALSCDGQVLPAATDSCDDDRDQDCSGCACAALQHARLVNGGYDSVRFVVADDGSYYAYGQLNPSPTSAPTTLGGPTFTVSGPAGFVAHYSADGAHLAQRVLSPPDNMQGSSLVSSAARLSNGDLVIAGNLTASVDLGCAITTGTGPEVFIARLDRDTLACKWALYPENPNYQEITGIVVDPNDQIQFLGRSTGAFTLGAFTVPAVGTTSIIRGRVDALGDLTALHSDDSLDGAVTRLARSPNGQMAFVNYYMGAFRLVRYSDDDPTLIEGLIAGGDGVMIHDVAAGPEGELAMVGRFNQATVFDPTFGQSLVAEGGEDGFVIVYDATHSSALSLRKITGTKGDNDGADGLAFTPDGGLYVGGYIDGQADFGDGRMLGNDATSYDAFLVRYDPGLKPVWAKVFSSPGTNTFGQLAFSPSKVLVGGGAYADLDLGAGTMAHTCTGSVCSDLVMAAFCP